MKEKDRIEHVRQLVKNKPLLDAALIWKRAAEKCKNVGNWHGAVVCYKEAETTGMANCGVELSLIYTYHLPDFEKAVSNLKRSDIPSHYYNLLMARLFVAFEMLDKALPYYLDYMSNNINKQRQGLLAEKGLALESTALMDDDELFERFEWIDEAYDLRNEEVSFVYVFGEMLKCYDARHNDYRIIKSLKKIIDEISAQYEDEKGEIDDEISIVSSFRN